MSQVYTKKKLIQGAVEAVTHTVCCCFTFFLSYLDFSTSEAFLVFGKLIEKFQSLNGNSEHFMMRKSEKRIGFLFEKTFQLDTRGIIRILSKQLS